MPTKRSTTKKSNTKRSTAKDSPRVVAAQRRQPVAKSNRTMEEVDESLLPANAPTPARYYQIKKGDTLLGVAGKAYGVKAGAARLDFARRINRHPLNRKYLRSQNASNLFPEGQLSFLPEFSCDVNAQITAIETAVNGKCFAVLWIPEAMEIEHPFLGKALDIPSGLLAEILKQRSADEANASEAVPKQAPMASRSRAARSLGPGELSMVADASVAPFRFICSLMVIFPMKPGLHLVTGPASGTLIGERHVLTAAHVVYNDEKVVIFQNPVIVVTPGDESLYKNSGPPEGLTDIDLPFAGLGAFLMGKSPIGSFVTSAVAFPKEHKKPPKAVTDSLTQHLFDYAVITLPDSTGKLKRQRERFGYWGSATRGAGTRFLTQANRDNLQDETITVSGYPVTEERVAEHGITQWTGAGPVADVRTTLSQRKFGRERLGYMILTEEGHSGSPAWRKVLSGKKVFYDLVAVHSRGGIELTAASGVLLTQRVMDNISNWMKQT